MVRAVPGCGAVYCMRCAHNNIGHVTENRPNEALRLAFNLLQPTGHVIHHQFNIQQLYVLPTLYLCVLYLSENKQRLVPLTP